MKNKISKMVCIASLATFTNISAQLKVIPNGDVGVGTFNPIARFHMMGNAAVFTSGIGYPTSCAFIRGNNNYSTPSTPDFTWYNNDQTGFFHPAINTIGVSTAGSEIAGFTNFYYRFYVLGHAYSSGSWVSSDRRFKTDIKPIEKALDKVRKLNGTSYILKSDEKLSENRLSKYTLGFVAQELLEVLPEVVNKDDKGFYCVNYDGIVPVLVNAIKEQQNEIEQYNNVNKQLQQQIDELKNIVNSLAESNIKKNNSQQVDLNNKNTIVLNQNVPNPFAESTIITYNIPSDFSKAQIIFTETNGKVIKAVDIKEKGQGSLNVFANDLSNGLYSYSLILDGKVMDTKKMVKE